MNYVKIHNYNMNKIFLIKVIMNFYFYSTFIRIKIFHQNHEQKEGDYLLRLNLLFCPY